MISKHIFTSDVISGKQLYIDELHSTGDLIVASTDFDIENNLKVGEDLSIGGDSILSGNANISGNLFVDQTFTAKGVGNFSSDLTVGGDLTVNGTTTTVNSTTLTVDDKNIELGSLDTPTNTTADGGGITLKGTTDKEFKWTNTSNAWNSSEHLGIADGKYLFTDKVRARDGAGLFLEDDGGNGIFVQDGGNVGIGTTNPSAALHVEGDGEFKLRDTSTHSPSAGPVIYFQGNNSSNSIKNFATINAYSSGLDTGDLTFNVRKSNAFPDEEVMRLTSSGNVGIGTTSPEEPLDVRGTIKTKNENDNSEVKLVSSGGMPHINFQRGTSANWKITSKGNGAQQVLTTSFDTSELMTVQADGNVGIGTTTPDRLLEIHGTQHAGNLTALKLTNDMANDNGEGVSIEFGGFSDRIMGSIESRMRSTSSNSDLIFSTNPGTNSTDLSERMRIAANGNVGIGTTSPTARLVVEESNTSPAHLGRFTNDSGQAIVTIRAKSDNLSILEFADADDANVGAINYSHASNYMRLKTADVERLSIDSSGRVGIGTISPGDFDSEANHLVIKGQNNTGMTICAGNTTSRSNIYFADGTSGDAKYRGGVTYDHGTNDLSLRAGGLEALWVLANGNVGIGTGSPSSKLHVATGGNVRIDDLLGIGKAPDGYHLDVAAPGASAKGIRVQTNNASANAIVHVGSGGSSDVKFKVDGEGSITTAKDVSISGNLTVNGTTTTVNSTTVTVDDKNIELGSVTNPTDTTANGGGITLKGATDKTIIWSQANNSWNLNQNLSIAAGKHIETEKLKALNNNGLKLEDDAGNGIHIIDGGNVEFSNDITVSGSSTFNGDIFANEDVNIVKNLNVGGSSVFENNVTFDKNINVSGGLNVEGPSVFENNVTFDKNINVSGDFTFNGSNPLEVKNGILDIDPAAGAPAPTTNKLYNLAGDLYWNGINVTSKLSDEQVQDIIGGMVSSNTEGGITVTYADNGSSAGKLNFSVDSQTDNNFTDTLKTKLDGIDAGATALPTFSATQNGKVLKVSGGNLSWEDDDVNIAVVPGGANTQVQFNNNGSFGGSANLTFDGTNLSCAGDVVSYASSDKKLKNNISNISSPIEKIKQINGVNFEWSEKQSVYTGKDVGVLAQDVEKVLPEVVSEREDGYLAVKYEKIIPLLIEAIKDQQKEIEELKSKLS